jgi:hypothetical protein
VFLAGVAMDGPESEAGTGSVVITTSERPWTAALVD